MPDSLATRADVARLLGRAAFGATGPDLNRWESQPYEHLVDSLFPPKPVTERDPAPDEAVRLRMSVDQNDVVSAGRWWLERMRTAAWPLEERMTLFWHDHFATGYGPQPDVGMMVNQNQTLRTRWIADENSASPDDGDPLFLLSGPSLDADGALSGLFTTA